MTGYVRELNEGVERMFEEMARYGLREPKFEVGDGSVRVILFKQPDEGKRRSDLILAGEVLWLEIRVGEPQFRTFLARIKSERQIRTSELGELLHVSAPTARNYMKRLESVGLVRQVLKSSTDPTRYWAITDHPFWTELES
jgi:ATP-dependent DNA helicase RecG